MVLQVFPDLYLPIMTEGNKRCLRPWRMYIPGPTWFRHRSLLRQLDAYIIGLLQRRWTEKMNHKAEYDDLLERRFDSILVCPFLRAA